MLSCQRKLVAVVSNEKRKIVGEEGAMSFAAPAFPADRIDAFMYEAIDRLTRESDGDNCRDLFLSGEPDTAVAITCGRLIDDAIDVPTELLRGAIRQLEENGWPLRDWQEHIVAPALGLASGKVEPDARAT